MLALGGLREGTLARLQYRHVKEDLEANILPLHNHVEAAIAKGKHGDFDTFLNSEAVQYLKIYLKIRTQGTSELRLENITETNPRLETPRLPLPRR
ncbi:hypothetical protein E6H34_00275 [Candidatus Bathyarchaeota archaeon]|nr:MAG: hypothetical protein E6H34_00275 [Candidatus Bathyarchaeota archaeon]